MVEKRILIWALLIALILISGCAYFSSESGNISYFQDNKTLSCTQATGKAPIINSSGDVIGYYEVKIDLEDKCVVIETNEEGSITFSLKNKS